jgi:hypothetical protein
VRFLGCTLWSDYRLFATEPERDAGVQQAIELVRDFSRIRVAPDFDQPFTPALSQLLFDTAVDWLEARFAEPHDGPTVVVTHHAPSRGSIAERFAGSPLNACFVSIWSSASCAGGRSSGSTGTCTTASTTASAAPAWSPIRAAMRRVARWRTRRSIRRC